MTPWLLVEKNPTSILPVVMLGATDGAVIRVSGGPTWASPPWVSMGLAVFTPL